MHAGVRTLGRVLHRTGLLGEAHFAVTDRRGGVSAAPYGELNLGDHVGDDPDAVTENRRRLASAADLRAERVSYMDQVHGNDVAVVDRPPAAGGPLPRVDAIVTRLPGAALAVLVADCVPVLLSARTPRGTVVAAAHAGRRGVQAGVVAATVAAMGGLDARPGQTSVYVGPAVCGRCYEVPAAMAAAMVDHVPSARSTSWAGTAALDLRAAVVSQLEDLGVADIAVDGACTAEDPALYSHRRDGVTGRLAGLVWTDG